MKAKDYQALINNYELAHDIESNKGLPYFGTNARTGLTVPKISDPSKKDLELFEKKLRGGI
jgi:hypothetical protein